MSIGLGTKLYCGLKSIFSSQTYAQCVEEEASQPAEAHEGLETEDVPGDGYAQQAADNITSYHQKLDSVMSLQ